MNAITDWLHDNDRPLKWLAKETDISYYRLHRIVPNMDNRQLQAELTIQEADRIEKIIPNFKQELRQ